MPRGNKELGTQYGVKTRFSGETAAKASKLSHEKTKALKPIKLALKGIATDALYGVAPISEIQKKPIAKYFGISVEQVTMAHLAIYKQITEAAKGNLQSLVFLRDMVGEKPVENINVVSSDFADLDSVKWDEE